MNREESARIINAFITELERRNGTTPVAQPAPGLVPPRAFSAPPPAPPPEARAPAPPPVRKAEGLGALIEGCRGFEIGSAAPAHSAPKQAEEGLGTLIKGCSGFEIGGCPAPTAPVEPKPAAQAAPAASPPPPPAPVANESAETLAIRKATERIGNTSALLGLLHQYLSEAKKPTPNRLVLRTTKDQVMKHFPQLAFSQLIPALDGVAG